MIHFIYNLDYNLVLITSDRILGQITPFSKFESSNWKGRKWAHFTKSLQLQCSKIWLLAWKVLTSLITTKNFSLKRKRNDQHQHSKSLSIQIFDLCLVIPEHRDITSTAFSTIRWRWIVSENLTNTQQNLSLSYLLALSI